MEYPLCLKNRADGRGQMNDVLLMGLSVLGVPLILAEDTFPSLLPFHHMHVTPLGYLKSLPSLKILLGAQWT